MSLLGGAAVRDIRQVRVNATGTVLKFTGCMGTLFLKALPSFLSYEIGLLATLQQKLPNVCAPVVHVRPDKNAHITFAIDGIPLATINLQEKWEAALAGVAQLQIASSQYVSDLRLAGLSFHRITDLCANLENSLSLLLSMESAAPNRLNFAELKQIALLTEMARKDFENLDGCDLPETIIHGDLNESNVFITSTNQAKFIDWSYSRLGHPFFALDNCLFSTFHNGHRMFKSHQNLCAAYIAPWQAYRPRNLLWSGLRAAYRLIPLEAAISLAAHIRELEAYEPGNVRYIPLLLRAALIRFGLSESAEATPACLR